MNHFIFFVGPGWARPSPAQARKIRAGLSAHGPEILICNKKTNKFGFFYAFKENIFHLLNVPFNVKIDDEIKAKKF